ncbi:MAG: DNA replication/repair protein RecF [Pseudomonadales bacterium]|nr:DNA replication/repair protein RecF [Pseudomonadales bacterium]
MTLSRLSVSNFRNISQTSLELSKGLNLIVGQNGAGKTSLLEAIHLLSSGRSFRSARIDPLIAFHSESIVVFGSIQRKSVHYRVGVSRDRSGNREIRINGESASRSSDLAELLPVLVLGPQTIELFTEGPEIRRRFLNWGVFHVKHHDFLRSWNAASKVLKQRNELLKHSHQRTEQGDIWTSELARYSNLIHQMRQEFFSQLKQEFEEMRATIQGLEDIELGYAPGWKKDSDLEEQLVSQWQADLQRGFTHSGFHRANLTAKVGSEDVTSVLSRGELKILSWALMLCQGKIASRALGESITYLVDDLPAELDENRRRQVSDVLLSDNYQIVATGIDQSQLLACWEGSTSETKLFHVKHGQFGEIQRETYE